MRKIGDEHSAKMIEASADALRDSEDCAFSKLRSANTVIMAEIAEGQGRFIVRVHVGASRRLSRQARRGPRGFKAAGEPSMKLVRPVRPTVWWLLYT